MKNNLLIHSILFAFVAPLGIKSQTTIWSDNFESYSNFQLTTATSGWRATTSSSNTYWGGSNSTNNLWFVNDNTSSGCPITGSRSLMIGTSGGTKCAYTKTNVTDILAYPVNGINVSGYSGIQFWFDMKAGGESGYDWCSVLYAFSASSTTLPAWSSWSDLGDMNLISTATTYSASLGCPTNTYLWIAFEWDNDGSAGTNPGAVVDNIKIVGFASQANNACASATNMPLTTYNNGAANSVTYSATVVGDNSCATSDGLNSNCFDVGKNLWYTFTPTVSGSFYVGVNAGTMSYPDVSVLSGTCGSFSELGCSGYYTGTCQPYGYYSSNYTYAGACNLTAGTKYYVMIDDDGGAGTFSLTVSSLSNDGIPQAAIIANCGTSFTSSTIGATNCNNCNGGGGCFDYTNLDCNAATNSPGSSGGTDTYSGMTVENDSWYQFCTTTAQTYSVTFAPTTSTCIGPGPASLQMNIYKGTSSSLTWVNGNATSGSLTYTVALAANGCAFIEVDGYAGENCDYSLVVNASPGCPLPLELLSFTGENIDNREIKLKWEVASEKTAYYMVEKSADGNDYSLVAKVRSAGQSNTKGTYYAIDDKPFDGNNYYRLSAVDENGVQNIAAHTMVTNKSHLPSFSAYPNPTTGKLTISLNNVSSPAVEVKIYDSFQNKVWAAEVKPDESGAVLQTVDLSSLPPGLYSVNAGDGYFNYNKKIIIAR